jgi:hypothetical protein
LAVRNSFRQNRIAFLLLAFVPFLLQIVAWNTTYRASRFAYNLLFLLFLCSAAIAATVLRSRVAPLRTGGWVLFAVILGYTGACTFAYTQTRHYDRDGRVKTARWILTNVRSGAVLGTRSAVDLPRNLGPLENLPGFNYVDFGHLPDFCIMDGYEYDAINRYFSLEANGYRYQDKDWWPSQRLPSAADMDIYRTILNSREYQRLTDISSDPPRAAGLTFDIKLLLDPAEYLHKDVVIFQKLKPKMTPYEPTTGPAHPLPQRI